MKVCPSCSFANEERFPACLLCNTLLVDVRSTPPTDPNHPEFARQALHAKRRGVTRRQLASAAILYAVIITLSAVYPGLVFTPEVLLLYLGSSVVVFLAILGDIAGQFTAGLLQGALSGALVYYFGPLHPFSFLMLTAHVVLPSVFWHWVEMIHGANR